MKDWHLSLAQFGPGLAAFWAIAGAVITTLNPLELPRSLELQTQAVFFRLRGPVAPPENIVILAMDEDSLSQGVNFGQLKDLEPLKPGPGNGGLMQR
ncbi:MAG: hypothetical protein HC866_13325 [Leptolyngbyaceae cyanobacterium RU_5_1]|nr:hypothetical protein [Leptolyngbyaceae cyanobacterium RU_5_1]